MTESCSKDEQGSLSSSSPERIRELFDALDDENAEVSWSAEEALYKEVDRSHLPLLVEFLYSDSYNKKILAIDAFRDFEARWTIPEIVRLLNDEHHLVRVEAAEVLGDFKAREAIPTLFHLLDDEDLLVTGYAAEALGKIGNKSFTGAIHYRLTSLSGNHHLHKTDFIYDRVWTMAHFWAALCLSGEKKYLRLLLEALKRTFEIPAASLLAVVAEESKLHEKYTILRELKKAAKRIAPDRRGAVEGVEQAIKDVEKHLESIKMRIKKGRAGKVPPE